MNVLVLLAAAGLAYFLAHRFYAPYVARAFGEDDTRPTPAVTQADGCDFVATRPHVLFAHHFSAIAAAGPILGPTMAILYGWLPAFLWIVVGGILIGAVHDYATIYVSMREGGRSIAEIARKMLGTRAFVFFALFIIFNLVVVNAVFINLTAVSLTSTRPVASLGLAPDQQIFRVVPGPDGTPHAAVGGIASTSAIVLTLVAPLLGWLLTRRQLPERIAYPIASVLCLGSVAMGFLYPVSLPTDQWIWMLALYVWLAAAVPVWVILQPREFVSVQFLYLGIVLLLTAVVSAGLKGVPFQAPAFNPDDGPRILGWIWPSLFITIACGAISGFHGMVGSGTTSKQVAQESHARIGYLAMLGESALALLVTLTIAAGASYPDYTALMVPPADAAATGWKANPVLAFSVGVAGICEVGLGIPRWLGLLFGLLMLEGFVLDTLDVSIRLNRYLLEEIWAALMEKPPAFLRNFWVNSGISVIAMLALAHGNAAQSLWPIFGTGNQLFASLSLMILSLWLIQEGRRSLFLLIPAILVMGTTVASLVQLLGWNYLPKANYLLATVDILFLVLAFGVIAAVAREARGKK